MAILWALLLYLWAIFTQEPISPAVALMVEVSGMVSAWRLFQGFLVFLGRPRRWQTAVSISVAVG